jgi:hypothetical protein
MTLTQYDVTGRFSQRGKNGRWVSGTIVSTASSFYRVRFDGSRERVKETDISQMVYDADTARYPISTQVKKVRI